MLIEEISTQGQHLLDPRGITTSKCYMNQTALSTVIRITQVVAQKREQVWLSIGDYKGDWFRDFPF